MTARYAFTVRYRRRDWDPYHGRRAHYFREKEAAIRYMHKLRSPGRPDLSPIVELSLERQELGPVETLWDLDGGWKP